MPVRSKQPDGISLIWWNVHSGLHKESRRVLPPPCDHADVALQPTVLSAATLPRDPPIQLNDYAVFSGLA